MRKLLLAFALTAAASGAVVAADDYGAPMPEGLVPIPLSEALAEPQRYARGQFLFTGRLGEVCQKKGCWVMLIDGDATARVMTRHEYYLPKDASGDGWVVGNLSEKVLDADTAAHMNADAPAGAKALAANDREWRITATSIRVD